MRSVVPSHLLLCNTLTHIFISFSFIRDASTNPPVTRTVAPFPVCESHSCLKWTIEKEVLISHLLCSGREKRGNRSREIDVRFISTVESHLSISMAAVVRCKCNPARKSRI